MSWPDITADSIPVLVSGLEILGLVAALLGLATGRLRQPRWSHSLRRRHWPLQYAAWMGVGLLIWAGASAGALALADAVLGYAEWWNQVTRLLLHALAPAAATVLVLVGVLELAWLLGVKVPAQR